ncbi:penicillin-binding protein activator, partial [Vibrio agarivorans]
AQRQLAALAGPARIEAALAWAQDYLAAHRAGDAAALLGSLGTLALNQGQRYRWLQLQAQIAMARQQPEQALSVLDAHQRTIDSLDPQRRARIRLLRADALALNGQALESLRLRVLADP